MTRPKDVVLDILRTRMDLLRLAHQKASKAYGAYSRSGQFDEEIEAELDEAWNALPLSRAHAREARLLNPILKEDRYKLATLSHDKKVAFLKEAVAIFEKNHPGEPLPV